MTILESLVQIRKDKRVQQKQMLKHLGINPLTMSYYESGKRKMPFAVMEKYAEFFGYEIRLLKK